jgi:two-component system, LytTR family, response regulator
VADPLRVIIVDDEPLPRQHLASVLHATNGVEVIAECPSGVTAVSALGAMRADLVFLDVQLPDFDGFGVIDAIGPSRMPSVVFTSAYAEFAVRAFDIFALDYLLKPVAPARVHRALMRARQERPAQDERLTGLLAHMQAPTRRTRSLAVRSGGQYVVIDVGDIDYIVSDGAYVTLHVQGRPRVTSLTLAELEDDILDPARFVRVHRSTIVNADRIASVAPQPSGDAVIVLRDGTRLRCSRRYRDRIEQRLHFTH